jgi:hypothetical protein
MNTDKICLVTLNTRPFFVVGDAISKGIGLANVDERVRAFSRLIDGPISEDVDSTDSFKGCVNRIYLKLIRATLAIKRSVRDLRHGSLLCDIAQFGYTRIIGRRPLFHFFEGTLKFERRKCDPPLLPLPNLGCGVE